jgi:hypothetical protein
MPGGATPRNTTLDSSALRARFGIATPAPWPTIEGVLRPSETTSPAT